jgi:hypothetical protein
MHICTMRTQRKLKLLGHAPFDYNDDILKANDLLVFVNSAERYLPVVQIL